VKIKRDAQVRIHAETKDMTQRDLALPHLNDARGIG
jgi:hypothetical protein